MKIDVKIAVMVGSTDAAEEEGTAVRPVDDGGHENLHPMGELMIAESEDVVLDAFLSGLVYGCLVSIAMYYWLFA